MCFIYKIHEFCKLPGLKCRHFLSWDYCVLLDGEYVRWGLELPRSLRERVPLFLGGHQIMWSNTPAARGPLAHETFRRGGGVPTYAAQSVSQSAPI